MKKMGDEAGSAGEQVQALRKELAAAKEREEKLMAELGKLKELVQKPWFVKHAKSLRNDNALAEYGLEQTRVHSNATILVLSFSDECSEKVCS